MKRHFLFINLSWFAIVALLLYALQDAHQSLLYKQDTIRSVAQEIRWQRFEADRAKAQVKQLPELRFIAESFEANDQNIYAVAKAAWKWGTTYDVSPYLIMAIAHRESNFDPMAQSYDRDGLPLAYGVMQVNARVWKPDMTRINEVDYNVMLGTRIAKGYIDRARGDVSHALWLYWGQGESYSYPPRVLASKYFN